MSVSDVHSGPRTRGRHNNERVSTSWRVSQRRKGGPIMQGTIRPSRRWLQTLVAAAFIAMSSPALSVVPLDCTGITGTSAAGTCTLDHLFTIGTNHFVSINENLLITGTGQLAFGTTAGSLNVSGNLTVNVGGSITANPT